jgi:hypothetical protein
MSDLDPESQHVLDLAAAARTPNAGDKSRVAQRLDAALGIAATASGAHAAAAKGTAAKGGSAALLKWIAGSALVTAALASYLVMSPQPARHTPHVQRPARIAAPPPAEPAPAPTETQPAPSATPAAPALPARTPHRVEHRRPTATNTAPDDEIGLLHRAQAAWRAQDAKNALALLAEHRARYPHSQLAPERDALQALSLCELGRRDDGARIARSVLARAPSSPLRASLEQSCALK